MRVHVCAVRMTLHRADVLEAYLNGQDNIQKATVYERTGDVVLTCREYLAQTSQLRHQAAQLVLRSYEGLRIPTNALRMSEDNQLGVYCVVGKVASFKPVSMVYRGDGYSLVQSASPSQDVSVLRPGDEVIVTSSKLSGGQIVQ